MKQIEPFNVFLTKVLIVIAIFVAALLYVTHVFGDHYPQYTNYINDFANVISPETEKNLNAKLKEYDKKTSNQIAVATIKSLDGEEIEQYTIHLAEQWRPGTKEKDNGLIMLFAMEDRKMRIEVGRGLEGDITDIEAKHVLDDVIKPEFKASNYDAGITKGVDALIISVATDSAAIVQSQQGSPFPIIIMIVLVIIIIVIIGIAISPYTPIGGQGSWGATDFYQPSGSSFFSSGDSDSDSDGPSFGGGGFSGGGSSSSW